MTEEKRFDEAASTWDEDPDHIQRAVKLAKELTPLIEKHQLRSALDYGSGTGLLSFLMAGQLEHITLMDTSQGMLEEAQRKIDREDLGHKMETVRGDLLLQPASRSFDLIYILMTLHHIQDTRGILQRFYEHLNPGGILCIADLDEEDGSFHAEYPDFDGHNGFDQSTLQHLLETTGFQNVRSKIFDQINKKTNAQNRSYSLFLMTSQKTP